MNKYQEALEILGYDESEYWEQQRRGAKFIEKYGCCAYEALQELVDKETTMKIPPKDIIKAETISYGACPKCNAHIILASHHDIKVGDWAKECYCFHCGQKLDWSDTDE